MKNFIKQALAFVGLSGIGWCLDFGVYTLLNVWLPAAVSNMFSAAVGVTFVFWTSTRKTFKNNIKRMPLKTKYIIYLLYQIFAISGASLLIGVIENSLVPLIGIDIITKYGYIFAKICVTPFTLALNFFTMKILVEKI